MPLYLLFLGAIFTGCGEVSETQTAPPPFQLLDVVELDSRGEGVIKTKPIPHQGFLQFRFSRPDGVSNDPLSKQCVQIVRLETPEGLFLDRSSVEEFGSICKKCQQRSEAFHSGGSWVYPNNGDRAKEGEILTIKLSLWDCNHRQPVAASLLQGITSRSVKVETRFVEESQETLELPVTVFFTNEASRQSRANLKDYMEAVVDYWYKTAGILVKWKLSPEVVRQPSKLELSQKINTIVGHGNLPLVFAGCFYQQSLPGRASSEPSGFTHRIPGGYAGSENDLVMIKTRECDFGNIASTLPPDVASRIINHELGHYLGLYHSQEETGATHHLKDGGASKNLMYFSPLHSKGGQQLSESQKVVVRSHPYLKIAKSTD